VLSSLADALSRPDDRLHDRTATYVSIEIANLWSCFVREHFLSCAVRQARTATGTSITYGVTLPPNNHDAILFALQVVDPNKFRSIRNRRPLRRRDEPNWFEPAAILRLANVLGWSIEGNIIAATSFPTTVFRDLPTIRNFYAHRSSETALKIKALARRSYGLTVTHPNELTIVRWSGRTQNVLSEWADDLKEVCSLMCA